MMRLSQSLLACPTLTVPKRIHCQPPIVRWRSTRASSGRNYALRPQLNANSPDAGQQRFMQVHSRIIRNQSHRAQLIGTRSSGRRYSKLHNLEVRRIRFHQMTRRSYTSQESRTLAPAHPGIQSSMDSSHACSWKNWKKQ